MPFKVRNGKTEITDLGTAFNVNAYENEADLKVTLLEGSGKIMNGNQPQKNKPVANETRPAGAGSRRNKNN
jgi:transmembrane sensor